MGQKVHPKAIRLGINETWGNLWSGDKKTYNKSTQLYLEVKRIWEKNVNSSLYEEISVQINMREIVIFVSTHKPHIIIGQKGVNINKIQSQMINGLNRVIPGFKSMNLNINIKVKETNAEISPAIIAQQINDALMAKKDFKKTMKILAEIAMENGALGLLVKVAGRIGGKAIASTMLKKFGCIPLQSLNVKFKQAQKHVLTKSGCCGVTCIVALPNNYKE
jgi:small subunit ribosomal protein S3